MLNISIKLFYFWLFPLFLHSLQYFLYIIPHFFMKIFLQNVNAKKIIIVYSSFCDLHAAKWYIPEKN